MPAVPGGRPARPAGRHPGRLPPPPATARARTRSPPGTTPRPPLPAFPSGRAGPPACPAAQPGRGALPLSPFPGPAVPRGCRPPAGRGPDLTRRAERSVRRRDPTDGPPPGTPTAPGQPPATPDEAAGSPGDPLLTIEEVTAELRVSRAAFYRWRRQGAGPALVRLPGGGVRVRRSALSQWLRRLEEATTAEEHGADGQLRRQVLGHQEDRRQRQRRTVPGPVDRQRAGALQVVQEQDPRRRVPRQPQGRRPRPPALQPPHRPPSRDHRRGTAHLVRACAQLRRGQVAQPGPGLPPLGRRSAGHRYGRPHREGEGRARAQGAAPGAVRLGVQPRHPRDRPAARDRPRTGLGRPRLAAGQRAGRPGHGAARARRVRQDPDGQARRRVDAAAQAVGVLQRPRLRRRTRPPRRQPHRPHPVDCPRRRPDRRPQSRREPRPGQEAPGRRGRA